jgi:drug/metabolite transporter (DMT)-like permease
VTAPLEYTALIWAFALGFAIWGDIPRPPLFMGAVLILSAGLLLIVAERRWARLGKSPLGAG